MYIFSYVENFRVFSIFREASIICSWSVSLCGFWCGVVEHRWFLTLLKKARFLTSIWCSFETPRYILWCFFSFLKLPRFRFETRGYHCLSKTSVVLCCCVTVGIARGDSWQHLSFTPKPSLTRVKSGTPSFQSWPKCCVARRCGVGPESTFLVYIGN